MSGLMDLQSESLVLIRLIAILVGIFVFVLSIVILGIFKNSKKITLKERLSSARDQEIAAILREGSNTRYGKFHNSYIQPQMRRYPKVFEQISKALGINSESLEQKINDARMGDSITAEEVVSMKLLGTTGLVVFIAMGLSINFNLALVGMGFLSYILGSYLPLRMIGQKAEERKEKIENELPDFLDLLKSVTESGLVIQEAISKVTARTRGPLTEEFRAVMVETKANGGDWRRAMENMATRNNIDNLSDIVSDILITYEKGTPISATLKKEADQMRQIKNSKLQEKAKGLSVKLIIPMAIFSFLPLLILLMGPMLMQLVEGMA